MDEPKEILAEQLDLTFVDKSPTLHYEGVIYSFGLVHKKCFYFKD